MTLQISVAYIKDTCFSCSQVCGLAEIELILARLCWSGLQVTSLLWACCLYLIQGWALLGAWSSHGDGKSTRGQLKSSKHT